MFEPDELNRKYDILERTDVSLVSIGHAFLRKNWNFSFEGHPFHRIYYVTHGHFRLSYPDGFFEIGENQLWLIPAFYPFHYEYQEPNIHYYFHFNSNFLECMPSFSHPLRAPDAAASAALEEFRSLFRNFPEEPSPIDGNQNRFHDLCSLKEGKPGLSVEYRMRFRLGLQRLLLPFLEFMEENQELYYNESMDRFSGIMRYIDEHVDQDIEIRELYTRAKMSQAEFSSKFRKAFGIPPKQYLCSRRICKAKMLLLRSHLTVAEIAGRCGYRDEYFFYRIFKKYTGFPPGEYRKVLLNRCN